MNPGPATSTDEINGESSVSAMRPAISRGEDLKARQRHRNRGGVVAVALVGRALELAARRHRRQRHRARDRFGEVGERGLRSCAGMVPVSTM